MLPYSIGEEELVNELLEDVLLGLAPAHPGEEHAEQGDGQQGLVQHHLGDHRPGSGYEGGHEGGLEGGHEGGQEGGHEGGHEGAHEGGHEGEQGRPRGSPGGRA